MSKNPNPETKEKIINAAIKVIKDKSVEDATVREIAEVAGLTTGSIYHYYKNKDELLYDVINHSIHFIYKLSEMKEVSKKSSEELLSEVVKGVSTRLSKIDEQKVHISLLSDVIVKDSKMKAKYKTNYENIINKTADMYYYTLGIKDETVKKTVAAVLVAALDGVAIQQSLGVVPEDQEAFVELFTKFFYDSIPLFFKKYMENDTK